MATVTQENIAQLNDKLIVTITKEDYLPAFEKSIKQYAKSANIPGFRKGMVPVGVVKKMYGAGVFNEQIFQAVDKAVNEYIKDNKIEIIGQPLPLDQNAFKFDVNAPQDYTFNFEIGLQPSISLNPSDVKVTQYQIEVSDKTVDEEVENIQRKSGDYNDVETLEDEEAIITLKLTIADRDGHVAEDAQHASTAILLKDFSKNTASTFKGKKVGESEIILLAEAFENNNVLKRVYNELHITEETNPAKETFVKAEIEKIGLLKKAELNETLFKKVFPGKSITTEAEFKAALKEDIERYFANQSAAQMQDQIFHALVDDTKVDFPEAFLKRWLKVNAEKPKTDEEVEAEYPTFVKQLQWAIISSKLSAENDIQVSEDDIKEFAKNQILQYMGGQVFADADADWVNNYVNRVLNDRKFIEDAHGQIRINKLFKVLETQVQKTEEKISEEAFAKKLHHHHH